MFQHWSGGEWFNNIKDINPALLKTGITGSGHQPPSQIKNKIQGVISDTFKNEKDTADTILDSLKNNKKVKQRIANLIEGNGLRVN